MRSRVFMPLVAVATLGAGTLPAQSKHGVTHGTPPNPQTHGSQSASRQQQQSGQRPPAAADSAFVAGVVTGLQAQGALGPVIYYTVYGGTYIGTGYSEYGSGYVDQPPPPANIEVQGPRPANAMAWVPGHWTWNGAQYYWLDGHWVSIPGGYTAWVAGHWDQNGLGYYWVPGYWRR